MQFNIDTVYLVSFSISDAIEIVAEFIFDVHILILSNTQKSANPWEYAFNLFVYFFSNFGFNVKNCCKSCIRSTHWEVLFTKYYKANERITFTIIFHYYYLFKIKKFIF